MFYIIVVEVTACELNQEVVGSNEATSSRRAVAWPWRELHGNGFGRRSRCRWLCLNSRRRWLRCVRWSRLENKALFQLGAQTARGSRRWARTSTTITASSSVHFSWEFCFVCLWKRERKGRIRERERESSVLRQILRSWKVYEEGALEGGVLWCFHSYTNRLRHKWIRTLHVEFWG